MVWMGIRILEKRETFKQFVRDFYLLLILEKRDLMKKLNIKLKRGCPLYWNYFEWGNEAQTNKNICVL